MHYKRGDGFVSSSYKTNVTIAAFTIAHAKLDLYSLLECLQTKVLYFDTDSVIFTSQPGKWMPPLGDYLKELVSEFNDGDHITASVSGGLKDYAYQTKKLKTCLQTQRGHSQLSWVQETEFFKGP